MNSELHSFIIWNKGREKTNDILKDIRKKFELLEVYEINWKSDLFYDNMTRFCGKDMPPLSFMETHHGVGPFLLCVIIDKNPRYDLRSTTKGVRTVNVNTFDAKQTYRSLVDNKYRIHGTETEEETKHDLMILLGKNLNDIRNSLPQKWDEKIKKLHSDTDSESWENLSQLFDVLNATVKYVVVRNFENLPNKFVSEKHNDIDILTDQLEQIKITAKAKRAFEDEHPTLYTVRIGNEDILFDFKHVGDQYFDPKWSKDILNHRVLSQHGFYIPCEEDYFYSLLYHVLLHKQKITDDYVEKLVTFASKLKIKNFTRDTFSKYDDIIRILDTYMRKMGYDYTRSKTSGFYNSKVVELAITKREYSLFKEKLQTKNWLEAAGEIYHQNKPWIFKMITNQHRSDFLFLLDIKKDDLALVIDADLGQIAIPLSRFCNVIAIENDPDKIEIMKLIAKQENRNNIQFIHSDIYNAKFETSKFNLIIKNGIEKIDSLDNKDQLISQQEILNKFYHLLQPGGTLYLGALNKFGLKHLLGEKLDDLQDFVYLKSDLAKSIFEGETGKKLRTLPHGKKEYEKLILKSGFKDVDFLGNISNYMLPDILVDLSNNCSSLYVCNNFYLVDDYDEINGARSMYDEKLRHLYEIFSEQLSNFYPSYSIIAHK